MSDQPPLSAERPFSWGVKHSFRGYVEAVGGVIQTAQGAERAEDGGFTFAAAPDSDLSLGPDGTLQGQGKYLGEVRFDAHGGMLKVHLSDLALEIGPKGLVITVADGPRRVEIAHLDLAGMTPGGPGEVVLPAALSLDGCQLLGDHYPARTPLDPVRVRVSNP